uniref:Tetratricopeptide repeat protein n=1 Tax=candidate division WOR-3 bacterium TaxID=2052148 RepID=A0A7C4U972_UNCW3
MIIFIIANVSSLINKGNKFFKEGKYDSALIYYNEAQMLSPNNPYANFNKGAALYKLGKYDEAIECFKNALNTKKKNVKSKSFYNLGNSYFKKGDIENALKSYINTLKINPDDIDAKKNIELIMRLKEKKEKEEKKEEKDKSVEQNLQVLKDEMKNMLQDYLKQQKKGGSRARDW